MANLPSGQTRSGVFSLGCGLLVGGLAYGFFAGDVRDDDLLYLAFTCGVASVLVAWSASVAWFLRDDALMVPRRRGFDVIPDAAEADDDR